MILKKEELYGLKELGFGACSKVYKYEDKAIKILNESGNDLHDSGSFDKLLGIKSNICVYPEEKVYIDDTFSGYSMRFVEGKKIFDSLKQVDIDDLMKAIDEATENIKNESKENIIFEDLNHGGILWDENQKKFHIIDTDFFTKIDSGDSNKIYKKNLIDFYGNLELALDIHVGQSKNITEYLEADEKYSLIHHKYFLSSVLDEEPMSLNELIKAAREVFKRKFNVDVKTFEQMDKILKDNNISFESEQIDMTTEEIEDLLSKFSSDSEGVPKF